MAIFTQAISAADVLAGLTTDTTKWAGANIANLDALISAIESWVKKRTYQNTTHTWTEATDADIEYITDTAPVTVGTWFLKYQFTTVGNSGDIVYQSILYADANNWIRLRAHDSLSANSPLICKKDAGAVTNIINGGNTTTTAERTTTATRDLAGNYELFYDGTSEGTAYDNFQPVPTYSNAGCISSGGVSVIDLKEVTVERI